MNFPNQGEITGGDAGIAHDAAFDSAAANVDSSETANTARENVKRMSVDTDEESRLDGAGTADSGASDVLDPILNSYALQAAVAGLLVIAVAYVINTGVWAAILAIWGTGFVLAGVAIHVAVTLSRRGSRG